MELNCDKSAVTWVLSSIAGQNENPLHKLSFPVNSDACHSPLLSPLFFFPNSISCQSTLCFFSYAFHIKMSLRNIGKLVSSH